MKRKLRVLVACEWSGAVRDAFRRRGHEAWSCDLEGVEPAGEWPNYHLEGDALDFLRGLEFLREPRALPWDLLIAFPPCTHLAVSGARYFAQKKKEQAKALDFVRALLDAPVPRIALENPVGVISSRIRKPDQIIQPWQFGHPESKKTCLWLKGLPRLKPTNVLPRPARGYQTPSGQNKLGPSPDRARMRGKTYAGIAAAMAQQWGG